MRTLVRGGRVLQGDALESLDILVEDGRITALGRFPEAAADHDIDARGCLVLPGFIDLHTHLADRIGRFELADGYASGTEVAVTNGVTTVCAFVTQGPGERLTEALARARGRARGACHADLLWHLTPTRYGAQDLADQAALAAGGHRTWKLYTTYRPAGLHCDAARLEEAFRRLGALGARMLVHCEDDATVEAAGREALDASRPAAHARLRPEAAETRAVADLIALSERTGTPLHVVHVSTAAAARAILAARGRADLTSETCPQYLWLDEGWLGRPQGWRWLCSPPLRGDREAFRALAAEGAFDAVATDHCAFLAADKDDWDGRDIRTVANGLPGLGALAHLAWRLWQEDPERAAVQAGRVLSSGPARVAGLADRKGAIRVGLDGDLVVLDPHGPPRPVRSTLADSHEPYPGFNSTLSFHAVLLRGLPVARHGVLTKPLTGGPLQPEL